MTDSFLYQLKLRFERSAFICKLAIRRLHVLVNKMNGASSIKSVICTGSSSGIGRATAIEFARHGYNVALTGRNEEAVLETARECRQAGAPEVSDAKCSLTSWLCTGCHGGRRHHRAANSRTTSLIDTRALEKDRRSRQQRRFWALRQL